MVVIVGSVQGQERQLRHLTRLAALCRVLPHYTWSSNELQLFLAVSVSQGWIWTFFLKHLEKANLSPMIQMNFKTVLQGYVHIIWIPFNKTQICLWTESWACYSLILTVNCYVCLFVYYASTTTNLTRPYMYLKLDVQIVRVLIIEDRKNPNQVEMSLWSNFPSHDYHNFWIKSPQINKSKAQSFLPSHRIKFPATDLAGLSHVWNKSVLSFGNMSIIYRMAVLI